MKGKQEGKPFVESITRLTDKHKRQKSLMQNSETRSQGDGTSDGVV